jgi:hypothetical protein
MTTFARLLPAGEPVAHSKPQRVAAAAYVARFKRTATPGGAMVIDPDGGISIQLHPFQILTLRLSPEISPAQPHAAA